MYLTELKNKEVINVISGKRLGFVCDVELDTVDARLLSIIVQSEGGGLFSKPQTSIIPWTCIQHIGEDLIIVRLKDVIKN
jgi:YlmC/YmxH family sporulation protein